MFTPSLRHVSNERQIYQSLLKEYRRPCFAGEEVNQKLTRKFVDELITLYNIIYDTQPEGIIFTEMDVITKEILSDINFEINRACKKADIAFMLIQNRLKSKSIKEWESITDSHPIC